MVKSFYIVLLSAIFIFLSGCSDGEEKSAKPEQATQEQINQNPTANLVVSKNSVTVGETVTYDASNSKEGAQNQSPIATANVNKTSVFKGESVSFSSNGSRDPDGDIVSYKWIDEEDIVLSESANFTINMNHNPGLHTKTLIVTDNKGATSTASVTIEIKVLSATVAQALLGPLSGATFEITPLGEATPIVTGTTTLGDGSDVTSAGLIQVSQTTIDDIVSGMYIISATGGTDIDHDDNLIWNTTPTVNSGTLHALVNNIQLTSGIFNVNILTEIIYQDLIAEITTGALTEVQLEIEMDKRAKLLLKDTADGDVDYEDILAWNPADDKDKLRVDYDTLIQPIVDKVYYGEDTQYDSSALINNIPIAISQDITLNQGTSKIITLMGSDENFANLTYQIVSQPSNGVLRGYAPILVYIPNVNFSGVDSFTFKVNNGSVDSAVVTVNITVVEAPIYYLFGTVSGVVKDAVTGEGIENLKLNIRRGSDVYTGNIFRVAMSDVNGNYSISDLPEGSYTIEAIADNYITGYFTVNSIADQVNENQNHALSPILSEGEIRIVLTWSENPRDLDSHLTGPDGNGDRFHVYFGNRTEEGANLDRDITRSYGPETITITQQHDGDYLYYVYNFSRGGLNALTNSNAKVDVYRESGLIATYNVSVGEGYYWTVFSLNNDQLTEINTIEEEKPL